MVKRTMNGKRLLILAAFAAFASFAMPAAFASTVSNQTNITIKWNTQAVGSLVIHTNYNASGAFGGAAAAVLTGTNGGTTGTCTAAPAGQTDLTVDFTNVTADGVKFTNCQYKNGFNAAIITSDPNGYQLGYAATAALPAGYGLCAIHNGTWINNMAVTQSAAATATVQTSATCTSGDRMDSTGTSNAFTPSPVNSTTGTNLGGDIELVIPANAAVGAATVTEQFTLTLL
jgi:hypothetical protein